MPNLVGPETVDTFSTDGTCTYNALALGGTPTPTTVMVGNQPLFIYDETTVPAPVTGVKINPLSPLPCQDGSRKVRPLINTTVRINGRLPAVTGDDAQLLVGGTLRPLTGPFQHPTIVIGSNLTS